jgi:hypothetical protein
MQLESTDPVSKLKETVEMLSGIVPSDQALIFNGQTIQDHPSLQAANVSDGDVIMVVEQQPQQLQHQTQATHSLRDQEALQRNPKDGSAMYPEAFIQVAQSNPALMGRIKHAMPIAAKAIVNTDVSALQKALREVCSWMSSASVLEELPCEAFPEIYFVILSELGSKMERFPAMLSFVDLAAHWDCPFRETDATQRAAQTSF